MFKNLIYTLNSIEVHGKDNLDKLLGCIMILERMQEESKICSDKEENADGR